MKKNLAVLSTILLVLFLLLDCAILGDEDCETTNPAAYEVEYTVTITNNGPTSVNQIDIWIPVIQEHLPFQRVEYWNSDPQPLEITEDTSGNKMAHIRIKEKIGPKKSVTIRVRFTVQINTFSCKPVQTTFEKYDKESELYKTYTAPETYIESDNSQIKEKAAEIAGKIDDPYLAAKKIYEFVISYMSYVRLFQCQGALCALQEKKGDCDEYSNLFVALCRARGIPARPVAGLTYGTPGREKHAWAEIYIPGAGWIPVDPTWGKGGKDYFGNITNRHIIAFRARALYVGENAFAWYHFTYWFRGSKPTVTSRITINITRTSIWYKDPEIVKKAESLHSEGVKCVENGDYDTAKLKFQEAKELYSKLGDSDLVGFCELDISFAETGQKAVLYFSEAMGYFEKKMYSEAKSKFIRAMNAYGLVENEQKWQECKTYISKCDAGIEADSLFEKGKAQIEEGTLDEAKLSFENAQKKYEGIGDTEKVQHCQKMIQEIEKKNQESEAEKEPEKKGFCLGTVFVVLLVSGGSAGNLRSNSHQ